MKKLLVLMLVFAMATVASATPTITVVGVAEPNIIPGGSVVTVTISGTFAEASGGTAGNSNTPLGGYINGVFLDLSNTGKSYNYAYGSIGNVSAGSVAMGNGPSGGTIVTTYYGLWFTATSAVTWAEGDDVDTGLWFTFDVTLDTTYPGETDGSEYLTVDIGYNSVANTVSLKVIPEPITIALLGLGGLFLRRRK